MIADRTCREWILEGKRRLEHADIEDAEADARFLFLFAFAMKWDRLLLLYEEAPKSEHKVQRYLDLISERAKHVPLQYITKEQNFCGFPIYVDERVLIPRQDTEVLVEEVEKQVRRRKNPPSLLDLCTGSACIPIALSKRCSFSSVTASDISEKALQVASCNAEKNEVSLSLVQSDLFTALSGRKFDFITANPPYIPTKTIESLEPEVKDHEPLIALDGDADGLCFYRRLSREARDFLNFGGMLFLEVGYDQGEEVEKMLLENGFQNVGKVRDLSGLYRVVYGSK